MTKFGQSGMHVGSGIGQHTTLSEDRIIEFSLEKFRASEDPTNALEEARQLSQDFGFEDAMMLAWARSEYYRSIGENERSEVWNDVEKTIGKLRAAH
jgi:hypothetical protein